MILVYDTADQVAEAAAAAVAWRIVSKPSAVIGLAGGGTPTATYRLLATANLDWKQATLFLGDERWVPHHHEHSNTKMIRVALGAAAADRLQAPDTTRDDPHAAAVEYTERMATHFDEGRPDMVLLGMGKDGHTASLFPGTPALDAPDPGFVANWVDSKSTWRLTATLPLLCSSRAVIFIVTGSGKAPMVHRILEHEERLPARLVGEGAAKVTWLLDADAASHLS